MSIYIFTLIMKWISSFSDVGALNDSKNLRFLGGLHGSIHRGKAGWNKWKNNWKCFIVKTVQWIIQIIQSSFHMNFFPVTSFYSVKWMKHVNFHIRTRRTDERTQNWISVERMKICIFTAGGVYKVLHVKDSLLRFFDVWESSCHIKSIIITKNWQFGRRN